MRGDVMKLALAGGLFLGATGGAVAQEAAQGTVSVAGVWELTMATHAGSFQWILTFEQDGGTLDGFAESRGMSFPLEGSVHGHDVTFRVIVPQHEEPLEFTGTVEGRSASGEVVLGEVIDWFAERMDGQKPVEQLRRVGFRSPRPRIRGVGHPPQVGRKE